MSAGDVIAEINTCGAVRLSSEVGFFEHELFCWSDRNFDMELAKKMLY